MLKLGRIVALLIASAHLLNGTQSQTGYASEVSSSVVSDAPFAPPNANELIALKSKVESARGALEAGMPSMAQHIIENSQLTKTKFPEISDLSLGVYIDSLIAQGKFEIAHKYFDTIKNPYASIENRIRAGLIFAGLGDVENAELALIDVDVKYVPRNMLGWYYLAFGYTAYNKEDFSEATDFFEKAKKSSATNYMTADAQVALNIARLASKVNTAELNKMAEELSDNVKIYMGTPAGLQLAKQYATVLYRLGKYDAAAEVIEQQLQIELSDEQHRDELRLIGAVVAQNSARRLAMLSDLLKKTSSVGVAEYAIILIQRNPSTTAEEFENLLKEVNEICSPKILDKILLERAKSAIKRNDKATAKDFAKKLIEEYPASHFKSDALRILAWAAASGEDGKAPEYRLAATYLAELSSMEKTSEKALHIKLLSADCLKLSGDLTAAANIYKEALDKSAINNGEILNKAVETILATSDTTSAEKILDKAKSNLHISDEYIWYAEWKILTHYRNSADTEGALKRIGIALQNTKSTSILRAKLTWLKAIVLRENSDFDSAIKICDDILTTSKILRPEEKNHHRDIFASTMLIKASCLESLGKLNDAIDVYNKLRKNYPDTDSAQISYINQARAEAAVGKYAEAQKLCIDFAITNPNSRHAYTATFDAAQYARKLGLTADYKVALSLLDKLCNANPNDPRNFYARLEQAEILRLLNSFGDARSLYNEIINKSPSHPEIHLAWFGLGDATLAQKSRELDAAAVFERLYALPDMPFAAKAEAAFKWSFALERAGKTTEANEIRWQTANELLKNKVESEEGYWIGRSLYTLAKAFESEGRMSDARAAYELIVKNNLPPLELAKKKIGAK